VFLIIGCVVAEIWWPFFNLFFFVLILLPSLFGSLESTGLLGSLGDFVTAVFAFSVFAFPYVLFHSDVINGWSFTLILFSNAFAAVAIVLFIRAQLDDLH